MTTKRVRARHHTVEVSDNIWQEARKFSKAINPASYLREKMIEGLYRDKAAADRGEATTPPKVEPAPQVEADPVIQFPKMRDRREKEENGAKKKDMGTYMIATRDSGCGFPECNFNSHISKGDKIYCIEGLEMHTQCRSRFIWARDNMPPITDPAQELVDQAQQLDMGYGQSKG